MPKPTKAKKKGGVRRVRFFVVCYCAGEFYGLTTSEEQAWKWTTKINGVFHTRIVTLPISKSKRV